MTRYGYPRGVRPSGVAPTGFADEPAVLAALSSRMLLENDFRTNYIRRFASSQGWELTYHTKDARGSESGFPDDVFLRDDTLLLLEAKKWDGKPSAAQLQWVAALNNVRKIHAGIYYPKDWQQIVRLLERKGPT